MSVEITDHALERWSNRSDVQELDPRVAWVCGIEIENSGLEGDEIRYHEQSRTCLVRKDVAIVTVVDATEVRPETEYAIEVATGGESA